MDENISLGEYKTEIEAAQAYNIGVIILNGEDSELNNVPTPSLKTFKKVIKVLNKQGWSCTATEMEIIETLMINKLGMKSFLG